MKIQGNLALQPKREPRPHFGVQEAAPKPEGELRWRYNRPIATDILDHGEGRKTKITSLIDGGQIFNGIDYLLKNAKDSVLLEMYTLQSPKINPERASSPGTPGADKQAAIVDNLIALAKKGIKVKVLLDNSVQDGKEGRQNDDMIRHLKANGVEVLAYPDAAKISHVKLLVVDGKYAVIGGMNWGNHSPTNHDVCVLLEGDAVGNLIDQIYKVDYGFAGGDVSKLPKHRAFKDDQIKVLTTSPIESPDGGQNEIYEEILDQIDSAQKSILCELFVLTDKLIGKKLIEAHKRLKAAGQPGVKVMVDPGLYLKFPNCRPTIDYLRHQGVPIRFYKSNWEEEEKLHGKWAVFDEERLLIGSANWSRAGLHSNGPTDKQGHSQDKLTRGNHEANLLIASRKICQAFTKQFFYDWYKKSFPVYGVGSIFRTMPKEMRNKVFFGQAKQATREFKAGQPTQQMGALPEGGFRLEYA